MNLYLLHSTHDEKKVYDLIVDLDKIFTLRLAKTEVGKFHITMDYTQSDNCSAVFNTEDEARKELANIIQAMNGTPSMASAILVKDLTLTDPQREAMEVIKNAFGKLV